MKSNDSENDSYLPTYNKLLEAQGKSAMKALNVEDLPSSIHSDGFGVLSSEEVHLIHQTKQAHKAFMTSRRQCALIVHVLGEQNVALVEQKCVLEDLVFFSCVNLVKTMRLAPRNIKFGSTVHELWSENPGFWTKAIYYRKNEGHTLGDPTVT